MHILVTGAQGQLGREVVRRLNAIRIPCTGVDLADFDLTDAEAVMAAVSACRPDAIIHCAAYQDIERAETEPEVCCRVNGMGTLNLVRAALHVDAKLLYVSTACVFPAGDTAYETDSLRRPESIFGQSKLQGEEAIASLMTRYFIVRTSWLYGTGETDLARTLLRQGAERREIPVAQDRFGSPTCTVDLAALLCEMVQTNRFGVYHAAAGGYCSAVDFARALMSAAGRKCRIRPVVTAGTPAALRRICAPRLSTASLEAAGFNCLPDWEDSLKRFVAEALL